MGGIVFDTSVYIKAIRDGQEELLLTRSASSDRKYRPKPLWLSIVVLQELIAGALDPASQRALAKLEKDFHGAGRLLVPNKSDWVAAGAIIRGIGEKYGFELVGRSRLTNDVLIASSVARTGLTLITANKKDFQRIKEFRSFEVNYV